MSEDFGKLERRHDVDWNSLIRKTCDKVALTKGMVHWKET